MVRRTDYYSRLAEHEILEKLTFSGAVLIEGPKASGKTFTGKKLASSAIQLDSLDLHNLDISAWTTAVLDGPTPRLIDEWQVLPRIWNLVRHEVDNRQEPGQFILTGSSAPSHDATRHSGAGRFSRLKMRTLSSFESQLSTGLVSLRTLIHHNQVDTLRSTTEFDDIVTAMMKGGWPAIQKYDGELGTKLVRDYLTESANVDVATNESQIRRRDPQKIMAVIRSIARAPGSTMSVAKIVEDIKGYGESISASSVESYLLALERVMLIEYLPAWADHLRSKTRLQTKPKRYFADPSLAIAALQANRSALYADPEFLGQVFENHVMRDLWVYAQHINASIAYVRDDAGLEVDAIVEIDRDNWAAIEIKMGSQNLDVAAKTLHTFHDRIDPSKRRPPQLIILTGGSLAYVRNGGINVVPITTLGP